MNKAQGEQEFALTSINFQMYTPLRLMCVFFQGTATGVFSIFLQYFNFVSFLSHRKCLWYLFYA